MINNSKLIAVIPARSGSKGIVKKNLIEIDGISIVERAFKLAKKNFNVDHVIISTDDADIYLLSKKLGGATPQPRAAKLASDSAKTIDVIIDLVENNIINVDDYLLLMQPTTPLRTSNDLNQVVKLMSENWQSCDAIVSVSKIDGPHPFKALEINEGRLKSLMSIETSVARQILPELYLPNGAFYLIKVFSLMGENTFIPTRTLPYVMDGLSSINLDNKLDLMLLETVIERGLATVALFDSK